MPIKLLFYGLPGAGKDTQTERLSQALGVPHFSAGQMLRDEVALGSELGEAARPFVERGEIVPGGVTSKVFLKKFLSDECQQGGYIVNGYPRNVDSLKQYLEHDRPTAVIHLVITDDLARERLRARARADDTTELIDKRIARYYVTEEPAVEYIKNETDIPVIETDGSLSVDEVTEQILEQISPTFPNVRVGKGK